MNIPTIDELVSAGVHFGHKSSRWNPKMKPFIFATRNQVHVIDLEQTQKQLEKALALIKQLVSGDGEIWFVGTKRQAGEIIRKHARSAGVPYVDVRWLGGTFTNFKTIQKTIRKLKNLYASREAEDFKDKYTKKERLQISREIEKLEKLFDGIKDIKKLPEAIFVIDINHEKIAVREANKTGVKVVALVDTNSDPDQVDYLIPGNDDAIKSIELVTGLVAQAVKAGKKSLSQPAEAKNLEAPNQTSADVSDPEGQADR